MTRPVRHALLAAALVALLAACSTVTRLAYNNAGVAAVWMVDDWFDLHDGQRDWVKERFGRLHAWHRVNELPATEGLLHDMAARAATGITREDARRIHGAMRALYERTIRQAIPDVADFLLQLQPEQVDRLERRFVEDNAEKEKQGAKSSAQERREARVRRYVERIDDWTGRLSPAQRDLVGARVGAMDDIIDDWMEDRRIRQAATLALLRARPTREAMVAGLARILLDTGSWRRPDYAAKLRARDEQVFVLVAALDATLSPEQRSRLHRRIAGYASDVARLMASAS